MPVRSSGICSTACISFLSVARRILWYGGLLNAFMVKLQVVTHPTKISFFKGNSELMKILLKNLFGAYKPKE